MLSIVTRPSPSSAEASGSSPDPSREKQASDEGVAGAPPAPAQSSVERVAAQESFSADEPLPAFTYPVIDDATKLEMLRRVEEARSAAPQTSAAEAGSPKAQSSVERVAAQQSFSADEPLPAFTFPVLDEATKQEVLRRVEEERGGATRVRLPKVAGSSPEGEAQSSEVEASSADLGAPAAPAAQHLEAAPPPKAAQPSGPSIGVLVRQRIDAACVAIDRNRSRLPVSLREPLKQVPSGVILAVLAALAACVLLGIVLLVASGGEDATETTDTAVEPAPAPKEDAVPREIEEAKKGGPAALEKLAERHPKDHRVWLALAASQSAKPDHAAAVQAVGKALAADPKASEEPSASDALSLAVRKRATTEAAFALLEGPMGSAGAAALYDLSIDPKVEIPLRSRAEKFVRSEAFAKAASPDVELAGALRYGKSCADRHALLPQAAEKGGQRTLDFLNVAKAPVGCGRGAKKDCYPCLRKDDTLKNAIAAIEKRAGK